MKDRLAGLGILDAVGADDVDADGAGKTEVKAAGGFVLAPDFAAEFLQWFLELKGVSVDRDFELADGMAAGEVANGVSGKKKNGPGFARGGAQLR